MTENDRTIAYSTCSLPRSILPVWMPPPIPWDWPRNRKCSRQYLSRYHTPRPVTGDPSRNPTRGNSTRYKQGRFDLFPNPLHAFPGNLGKSPDLPSTSPPRTGSTSHLSWQDTHFPVVPILYCTRLDTRSKASRRALLVRNGHQYNSTTPPVGRLSPPHRKYHQKKRQKNVRQIVHTLELGHQ